MECHPVKSVIFILLFQMSTSTYISLSNKYETQFQFYTEEVVTNLMPKSYLTVKMLMED